MSLGKAITSIAQSSIGAGSVEYLFINVYRIKTTIKSSRVGDEVRKDTLKKLASYLLENTQDAEYSTEHIASFSTLTTNRMLGLQVENASVYGSKIELSFEDMDFSLSTSLQKNDIIIIHRVPVMMAKLLDVLESTLGTSQFIKGANKLKNTIRRKRGATDNSISSYGQSMVLANHKPIFSGLITKPSIVSHGSTQLRIEAQDIVRIFQQINTERRITKDVTKIPTNIDDYFLDKNPQKFDFSDTIPVQRSVILTQLARAFIAFYNNDNDIVKEYSDVASFIDNPINPNREGISEYFKKNPVINISDNFVLVCINPLRALSYFVNYFTSQTNMTSMFSIKPFSSLNDGFKAMFNVMKDAYSTSTGVLPYITFGMIRDVDDDGVWRLRHVFSEHTLSAMGNFQKTEYAVTRTTTASKVSHNTQPDDMVSYLFKSIIGANDIGEGLTGDSTYANGNIFYKSDEGDVRLRPQTVQDYLEKIVEIQRLFDRTLSFSLVFNSRIRDLRSAKYNPLIGSRETSLPLMQVLQLFIGSVNMLPLSQSKSLGQNINASYDISQRVWIQSEIGFYDKNDKTLSYYHFDDSTVKPTILFTLEYSEVQEAEKNHILPLDKIIDYEFYDLPSEGSFTLYGESGQFNNKFGIFESSQDLETVTFSLGSLNNFDAKAVYGEDLLTRYETENSFNQLGKNLLNSISRKIFVEVSESYKTRIIEADELFKANLQTDLDKKIHLGFDCRVYPEETGVATLYVPVMTGGTAKMVDITSTDKLSGVALSDIGAVENLEVSEIPNEVEFPIADNTCFVNVSSTDKSDIVLGVQTYLDPLKFLPTLQQMQRYLDKGFTGFNGKGDQNKYKNDIMIYSNFKFTSGNYYVEIDDDKDVTTIAKLVDEVVEWLDSIKNNEKEIALMYARRITTINKDYFNGTDGGIIKVVGSNKTLRIDKIASYSKTKTFENVYAVNTIKALATITYCFSHYMNRVATSSTIGGVAYVPASFKNKDKKQLKVKDYYFDIGDAIAFTTEEIQQATTLKGLVKQSVIQKASQKIKQLIGIDEGTRLDIFKKTFFIWKVVSYFGGASTSGTSGSTQRLYVTDSGLQWSTSYEEDNITAKIAESIRLRGLPFPDTTGW